MKWQTIYVFKKQYLGYNNMWVLFFPQKACVDVFWESMCSVDPDTDEVWVMSPSADVEKLSLWGPCLTNLNTQTASRSSLKFYFLFTFKVKGKNKGGFRFQVVQGWLWYNFLLCLWEIYSNILTYMSIMKLHDSVEKKFCFKTSKVKTCSKVYQLHYLNLSG